MYHGGREEELKSALTATPIFLFVLYISFDLLSSLIMYFKDFHKNAHNKCALENK